MVRSSLFSILPNKILLQIFYYLYINVRICDSVTKIPYVENAYNLEFSSVILRELGFVAYHTEGVTVTSGSNAISRYVKDGCYSMESDRPVTSPPNPV